jgi:hypothetical protein
MWLRKEVLPAMQAHEPVVLLGMCACVYVCVCAYIYVCVCIYIYIHTHTHIRKQTYTHTDAHTHTHTKNAGMGEGLHGANSGIAVDVVRAWVLWFLGEQPEHQSWEMAPPDKANRAPLWAQVFFLIRTVCIYVYWYVF